MAARKNQSTAAEATEVVEVQPDPEVVEQAIAEAAETPETPETPAPLMRTKTWGGESPQILNLKTRYGVTKTVDILRAIQKRQPEGVSLTLRQAQEILDGELAEEYARIIGGAYDPVVVETTEAA